METVNVVVLSGAPGVGKTSLAEEMFDQLCERDVRHAVIDVDALSLSYPYYAGDPYNSVTAVKNVASVWANFSRQGINRLVLIRVVESRADVDRLLAAIPGPRDCLPPRGQPVDGGGAHPPPRDRIFDGIAGCLRTAACRDGAGHGLSTEAGGV